MLLTIGITRIQQRYSDDGLTAKGLVAEDASAELSYFCCIRFFDN